MNASTTPLPRRGRLFGLVVLVVFGAVLVGCQRKAAEAAKAPLLTIPVSRPVEQDVKDFSEYTGRTDAVESVSVRARATGELKALPFAEGTEVRGPVKFAWLEMSKGDLLFRIDPRPYEALVKQAEGQLLLYKAQRVLAQLTYDQDKQLYDTGSGSPLTVAQDEANLKSADARIESAEGALDSARLNLSFTEIHAPISGRISRYFYTPGNQVSANTTLLTTIVSMEKMYAYFDVEERTFQRLLENSSAGLPAVNVRMTIESDTKGDAKGDPNVFMGKLNFINNQVNPSTGTVALRAIFDNKRTKSGLWKLLPGMFVRVRIELGGSYRTPLVIDRAIGSDQGLKFVYVLDAENKIQYRRVVTGPLQEGGLRVIEPYKAGKTDKDQPTGVKLDEYVVVGGLPQLRPKMEIQPDKTPMPTAGSGGDAPRPKKQ